MTRRAGSLELDEHMRFQAAEWAFEAIGGLALLGFVVAAALGAFGKGPESRKTAGREGSAVWVKYESPARWETRTMIEIHAMPSAPDNKARVAINDDYLRHLMVQQITPEPESVEVAPDRTTFVFTAAQREIPVVARFHVEPEKPGTRTARLTVGDATAEFEQKVLP